MFDLVAGEEDRHDRRHILVRRTARGAAFFSEVVGICRAAYVLPSAEATQHRLAEQLWIGAIA